MIHQLKKENEQLKNQVKGMTAQATTQKQMLSELLDTTTILRTNLQLLSDAHNEIVNIKNTQEQVILSLNKRIGELESPTQSPDVE